MEAITLTNLEKIYATGELTVPVLRSINLKIHSGELIAIMGPSGSGKSTLMNIIGLLDRPTKGEVQIAGQTISLDMSDTTLAHMRSDKIGFVFQSFQLLPRLTALENVLLPTLYRKEGRADRVKRAQELLARLGLAERGNHHPTEMSGGERQRIAIARALMNNPEIILADEPTGNLDSKAGNQVMDVLEDLAKEGKTVVVITHDKAIAERCQRTVHIFDGTITQGERHG